MGSSYTVLATAEGNYLSRRKGNWCEISCGLHTFKFQFPCYQTEGSLRMLTSRGIPG